MTNVRLFQVSIFTDSTPLGYSNVIEIVYKSLKHCMYYSDLAAFQTERLIGRSINFGFWTFGRIFLDLVLGLNVLQKI